MTNKHFRNAAIFAMVAVAALVVACVYLAFTTAEVVLYSVLAGVNTSTFIRALHIWRELR